MNDKPDRPRANQELNFPPLANSSDSRRWARPWLLFFIAIGIAFVSWLVPKATGGPAVGGAAFQYLTLIFVCAVSLAYGAFLLLVSGVYLLRPPRVDESGAEGCFAVGASGLIILNGLQLLFALFGPQVLSVVDQLS